MKQKATPYLLRNVSLFQGLSPSELEAIRSRLKERSYSKGEILRFSGDLCQQIFIVVSGRVKIYRTASSGREQILEILDAGGTCACNPASSVWHCSATAEALTPCTVFFLPREDYVQMVTSSSKLTHALNRLFAERICRFSSLIEEVSLKDAKKKLIKFLLYII